MSLSKPEGPVKSHCIPVVSSETFLVNDNYNNLTKLSNQIDTKLLKTEYVQACFYM